MEKTITMKYEEYKNDLHYECECGKNEGVNNVLKFLESNLTLKEFLEIKNWIGKGAALTGEFYEWQWVRWVRIAKAVNRKIE